MELRYRQTKHEGGFTLLESLIALVVFSVALLALAAMYTKTLSMSHSSYLRALASIQAMDLEERIRANPNSALNDYHNFKCTPATAGSAVAPESFDGDAAHIASQDKKDWCANTSILFGSLLQEASINVANYASAASGTAPADVRIGIKWNERAVQEDNSVAVQAETFEYTVRK